MCCIKRKHLGGVSAFVVPGPSSQPGNIWSWYETTPTSGFVGFGRFSDRLVVWTPLFLFTPCVWAYFTGCTKIKTKQQTEGERKKQTNTDSELQNAGGWRWHFLTFFVCKFMVIARILRKSYTATKDADSSSLVIAFIGACLRSWLQSALRLFSTHAS